MNLSETYITAGTFILFLPQGRQQGPAPAAVRKKDLYKRAVFLPGLCIMVCDHRIGLRHLSIPPGTPRFLQVLFRCPRQPMVNHGSDILFVHAQAVRRSSHQNAVLGIHEPLLDSFSLSRRKTRMIIPQPDAPELRNQCSTQSHCIRSLAAENNCRLLADTGQLYNRLGPVQGSVCPVKDVGPVGIGPYYQGTGEKQAGADVADSLF